MPYARAASNDTEREHARKHVMTDKIQPSMSNTCRFLTSTCFFASQKRKVLEKILKNTKKDDSKIVDKRGGANLILPHSHPEKGKTGMRQNEAE